MVSVTMIARPTGAADAAARWSPGPSSETARGRPPSPLIGAGYVWAMQLVAFGSALLQQWACG